MAKPKKTLETKAATSPEPTVREQTTAHLAPYQFKPGESGNPAGRPKGVRNKFGEAFLEDFYADWQANGVAAIKTVRETRPQDYLKAAVQILPKEFNVRVGEYDEMTNEELDRAIIQLAKLIDLNTDEGGTGEGAGGKKAPARAN